VLCNYFDFCKNHTSGSFNNHDLKNLKFSKKLFFLILFQRTYPIPVFSNLDFTRVFLAWLFLNLAIDSYVDWVL
jgi:hypothetical protein